VTGSKDATVAVAAVREGGTIARARVLSSAHDDVVKCVRLPSSGAAAHPSVVASAGNDRRIALSDVRAPRALVAKVDGAHDLVVNSLAWGPASGSPWLLMSASFDPHIKLWDTRKLGGGTPLHVLSRHHAQRGAARCRSIYHPLFVARGARTAVVTSGDRSEHLSVYDAGSGALCSRGLVGFEASAMSARDDAGSLVAVAHGRDISLLRTVWECSS